MTVELPESVINGRFRVTERPMVAPGKCAVCGAVSRPVVDFGMDVDFYGAVLFCFECILSAHEVVSKYVGEGTTAPTPVVPHFYLDEAAINEYVRNATDSIIRLSTMLDRAGVPSVDEPQMDEASTESDGTVEPDAESGDDDSDSRDVSIPEQDDLFTFIEGPVSVPADSGDESGAIFNL